MPAQFGDGVPIAIVPGRQGAEFRPSAVTLLAGTSCVWSNETDEAQEVTPLFKGGALAAGSTRLTLARQPGTYVYSLVTNPHARLTITAI